VDGREPLPLLAAVPPALCARRLVLEKWSIQEAVAHLADNELVGAYRIRLSDTHSRGLTIGCRGCEAVHAFGPTTGLRAAPHP
jgi:hypothetical protein